MTPDERFPDDAVLRRLAAARPAIREQDLSPTSERATAIADRVLQTHRPIDPARPRVRTRWFRRTHRQPAVLGALGLTAAAACVVLVIAAVHPGSSSSNGQAAADVVNIRVMTALQSRSQRLALARTPLGAQIAGEHQAIEENIHTGDAAQNRQAIAQLTSNEKACDQAATTIERVRARPAQRAAQRYWVLGVRLQATGDRQLISALRAVNDGHTAAGKRDLAAALDSLDRGDGLTGYGENELLGDPGPPPHDP